MKAILVSGVQTSGDTRAAVLFYRVEQLKQQKSKLEDRRRLLSRNQDLENAITALDGEIEIIRSELAEESKSKRRNSK